ncbi:MAG TPA: hypothetical protein VGT44_08765 [Ktedonobacteraceae bacterium]|nr:hypothetical protein [Ktedonobacteraceae bacterium]
MNRVVEVSNLTKSFGRVVAVDQVSFSIEAGKIYGLLGATARAKRPSCGSSPPTFFPPAAR